jgi:hypothetical protein
VSKKIIKKHACWTEEENRAYTYYNAGYKKLDKQLLLASALPNYTRQRLRPVNGLKTNPSANQSAPSLNQTINRPTEPNPHQTTWNFKPPKPAQVSLYPSTPPIQF